MIHRRLSDRASPRAESDFATLDFLVVLARRKRVILSFTPGAAALAAIRQESLTLSHGLEDQGV